MADVTIVTEDNLSTAMVGQLVAAANNDITVGMRLPKIRRRNSAPGNTYIETKIQGFNHAAQHHPYLILLDIDARECAPGYVRRLLPDGPNRYMVLRIAVREVESWILADREGFHEFSGVAKDRIPNKPDTLSDPKQTLINLVKRSRNRGIRDAIVPRGPTARIGPDYNATLRRMLAEYWSIDRAMNRSPSLASAFVAIQSFRYP